MKKEINQIVSNLSDFQMTSLTSLSQLETILPQMEILSSLNHTVSQLTSSMENVKETNSLLTSRAQTIDEVVLGKHHNNLYHDNLHNCYNDDPSSLLIKQQQQQHHHHQQQKQQLRMKMLTCLKEQWPLLGLVWLLASLLFTQKRS
mmetsp:Transcript_28510/g.36889  ORF Transcript_28510/g.36889 Transcript_28510/m.36889 type:complete len:146 (-) Transcript_28510:821-1258(-)